MSDELTDHERGILLTPCDIVSERFLASDDSPPLDWSDVIAAAERAGLEANRALVEAEQRRREALRPSREPECHLASDIETPREPEPTDEEGDAA